MSFLILTCPACGGRYDGPVTDRFVLCEYCGTRFALGKDALKAMGFRDKDDDGIDDRDQSFENTNFELDEGALVEFAEQACKTLLEDLGTERKEFKSTRKVIAGLGLENAGDILLAHDDTLFKTGKDGFAITREGIFCREMGEDESHFISWQKFAHGKRPLLDGSYIRQGALSIGYYTGNDGVKQELLDFFERLWKQSRR